MKSRFAVFAALVTLSIASACSQAPKQLSTQTTPTKPTSSPEGQEIAPPSSTEQQTAPVSQPPAGQAEAAPQGPHWSAPHLLESRDDGDATTPTVEMNASGDAVVAWHFTPTNDPTEIWTSRRIGGVWKNETALDADDATFPELGLDGNGNAFALWLKENGPQEDVRASHTSGAFDGWYSASTLDGLSSVGRKARLSVSDQGRASAIWIQAFKGIYNIAGRTYNANTGWSAGTLVFGLDGVIDTALANDDLGNNVAVWTACSVGSCNVWYNLASGGVLWNSLSAKKILADKVTPYDRPQIATNEHGRYMIVWEKAIDTNLDGQYSNEDQHAIWAVTLDAATSTLGTPVELHSAAAGNGYQPRIAMDAEGNAVVVWQSTQNNLSTILTRRFEHSTQSWSNTQTLQSQNGGTAQNPDVAMDDQGHTIAVWEQEFTSPGSTLIQAAHYEAGQGWEAPQTLQGSSSATAARVPRIAMDRSHGKAVTVWMESDGNHFSAWQASFE